MGEIKHTERFAEIERIFGDYFNSHFAPVMRDTQSYLNRKQVEEMAEYSTSMAGILSSMASAQNPMMDPYQTLKVTGGMELQDHGRLFGNGQGEDCKQ